METRLNGQLEVHKRDTDDKLNACSLAITKNTKCVSNVEKELNAVKQQLENINRINNLCCLNIYGVPRSADVDYDVSIIHKIAMHFKIHLPQNAIQFCRRMVKSPKAELSSPIFVRFSTKDVAQGILQNYFTSSPLLLRNITEEDLSSRVYINEHLTQTALKISHECYRLKKLSVISKVYTRNGHVFVSKGDGAKSIRIDTMDFLRTRFIPQSNDTASNNVEENSRAEQHSSNRTNTASISLRTTTMSNRDETAATSLVI